MNGGTSAKLYLTVRSPISSSFATRGKEVSVTCASSGKIIGGRDASERARERWRLCLLPKLYPELLGVVQALCSPFLKDIKSLCSLHTQTNVLWQPFTDDVQLSVYRNTTLRVFRRSMKLNISHHRRQLWKLSSWIKNQNAEHAQKA